MTETKIDYSKTLYLPQTDFPMRAGLPEKEPLLVERWKSMDLYRRLRESAAGRPLFVLHDGPPYANGNIHIGHALNKILKDVITRSFQMRGYDSNYVPGWDCHGLPIEWKIEERYRAKGLDKDQVPVNEFRRECREFAQGWIDVQGAEFQRLGVVGDFDNPYTTMAYHAEARIAGELMKFAMSDQLYRGSKPVMWSVVERTALAEAEVEYQDYESDTIWVKFPVKLDTSLGADAAPRTAMDDFLEDLAGDLNVAREMPAGGSDLSDAAVVIWTTTPWTIPGNRAVSYSPRVAYGLYRITEAENDFGPRPGEKLIFADALAEDCAQKAKLKLERLRGVSADELSALVLAHPLAGFGGGYLFDVPLLAGDHVTDDAGTGFVHTAPGHGREDFDVWMDSAKELRERGIDTAIPFTVDDAGFLTRDAPGFGPDREGGAARVIDDSGKKGDANKAVIEALIAANRLFARGRLKHSYPHSWRSKKPVIFRNTPQWFVHMDKELGDGSTLRTRALKAIDDTRFVPAAGQTRLRAMIEERPDWVLSRQRAWGVPICVFADEDGKVLKDDAVNARIIEAFEAQGADAWFADGARERFLGSRANEPWTMVTDILDVWFDSGSTHTFTLEDRPDMKWPADVYLEGSDQHRGWFHSSLLESCGTRGRAPYKAVLTHGFTMDAKGLKMSKSLGNTISPIKVMESSGADIIRLWALSVDFTEDHRIGDEILKGVADQYRKLRNTFRYLLGALEGFTDAEKVEEVAAMPELERYMLSLLADLDAKLARAVDDFDFNAYTRALADFCNEDLSAFYFDIRKDRLYCDVNPASGYQTPERAAYRTVLDILFHALVRYAAPVLVFTAEEVWGTRCPDGGSVHLLEWPAVDAGWRDTGLAATWESVRAQREAVTEAIEPYRRDKAIRSSLEAEITLPDPALDPSALEEVFIVSSARPGDALTVTRTANHKCGRCWRHLPEVVEDGALCNRCSDVLDAK